jgi:hypothetical protein
MNAYISIMLKWILIEEGVQWIQLTQERIYSFDTRKGLSSWAQHPLLQYDLAEWGQYIINPTESQKVLGIRRQSGRKYCLPWPNHSHIFNIKHFSQNWVFYVVIPCNTLNCQFHLTSI